MPCLCSCALHYMHLWNGLGWLLSPSSHTSFRPKQWVPCMGCEGMRPDTSGQLLNPSFIWLQNLEPLSMIGISIMSMTWPLCLLSKNILLWQPELPKQDLALCSFTWGGGRKTCQLHSLTDAEVSWITRLEINSHESGGKARSLNDWPGPLNPKLCFCGGEHWAERRKQAGSSLHSSEVKQQGQSGPPRS